MKPTMLRRAMLLGLFSVAVLASEIALTRIFSVIFWYHFGFLILSTAMLGFGIGGLVIRVFREKLASADPDRVLAVGVGLSGLLLMASMFLITHNHFHPLSVHKSTADLLKFVITPLILLPPFVLMGAVTIFVLQKWSENVNILYAANLLGSGIGCLFVLTLLDGVGGLNAYLILAVIMPLLAAWYAWRVDRRLIKWLLGMALLVGLTIPMQQAMYPLDSPMAKPAAWANRGDVVFSKWTSLSKLDIFKESKLHSQGFGLWGLSTTNKAPLPTRLGVLIDYWAYTTIIQHMAVPHYYDFYENLPMYMAYKFLDNPEVLIIGAGGGMDIRGALLNKAKQVDAVEINPAIYEAMTGPLAFYSGGVYKDKKVNAHLAEGRRFVESSKKKYDLVQLSGVDTYSATQAGAFALSENFLYTKEAMTSYLNHLSDDGVLTMTRWYVLSSQGKPRFSMRLFVLAHDSLADMGVKDPGKQILFFRSGPFTVILIKKKPFTAEEIAKVEAENKDKGYVFLYRPDQHVAEGGPYESYATATDKEAWLDDYEFNVSAPTDDNPFFFEHRKMDRIYHFHAFLTATAAGMDGQTILALLLVEMMLVGIVLVLLSFRLQKGRSRPLGWLYFLAIGLGFMLVEVTFSQRLVLFLGHPAYALSVVMFTVLVFSGVGSMLLRRFTAKASLRVWLLVCSALLLAWALFGTDLLRAMIAWPQNLRILMAIAFMAPIATLMGLAFPEAVRRLMDDGETDLGVYWAWNGLASVTASILAVVIAMGIGFSSVMFIAMGCYILAALLVNRLGPSTRID